MRLPIIVSSPVLMTTPKPSPFITSDEANTTCSRRYQGLQAHAVQAAILGVRSEYDVAALDRGRVGGDDGGDDRVRLARE